MTEIKSPSTIEELPSLHWTVCAKRLCEQNQTEMVFKKVMKYAFTVTVFVRTCIGIV